MLKTNLSDSNFPILIIVIQFKNNQGHQRYMLHHKNIRQALNNMLQCQKTLRVLIMYGNHRGNVLGNQNQYIFVFDLTNQNQQNVIVLMMTN